MNIYGYRNLRINRLVALALFTCCFLQAQAGAQSITPTSDISKNGTPVVVGLFPGDVLRYSAFNPKPVEGRGEPIRMKMRLYDTQGNIIAESAEVVIPPDEFRHVDFNRNDLPLAGDPGTGLLQVRTTPLWGFSSRYRGSLSTSLEVKNSNTTSGTFKFFFNVEALP